MAHPHPENPKVRPPPGILARKCGKCVSYAKNTLDYAEISTADKIDNDIRTTVKRKALQSLTHKLSSSPNELNPKVFLSK